MRRTWSAARSGGLRLTGGAFLAAASLFVPTGANAACSAVATGNWSAGATWSGCTGAGGVPGSGDAVTIPSAVTVTLDVDAVIASLTFAAPTTNSGLTHSGGHTLTVNGPVTLNQPTSNTRADTWAINDGSATVTGVITFAGTGTTTSRISKIVLTTGELNAGGGITFQGSRAATKVIDMSGGAGRLNLVGALTGASAATLTAGSTSVFSYADNGASQSVGFWGSGAYAVLALNNTSSGGVMPSAAISSSKVTAGVKVESGLFDDGGFGISGTTGEFFEVDDGATFLLSGSAAFPSSFSTYTFGPLSRVRFIGSSTALTLPSQTFGTLDLVPTVAATLKFPAGALTVQGALTVGDGTNAATADLNSNGATLTVAGNVAISANGTLIAAGASPLSVGGNWSNAGTFTTNASTVTFNGAAAQTVDNAGKPFGDVVLANTAGGVTFLNGFSAQQMSADTSSLGSGTTAYFQAGQTVTATSLILSGTPSRPITLQSTSAGTRWSLVNSGAQSVSYVRVRDGDASGGQRILDIPAGEDLGNNLNWVVGLNPPSALTTPSYDQSSVTFAWPAAIPAPDSYVLQTSGDAGFTTPDSVGTSLLSGTTTGLSLNTVYYGRIASVISGRQSGWSAVVSTATLAAAPATAAQTWTSVNVSSITIAWSANGNRTGTSYVVDLSPVSNFSSGVISSTTANNVATFVGLSPATVYFGRVQALNSLGAGSASTSLGNTTTLAINPPPSFTVTGAQTTALTGGWTQPVPAGDSYTLQATKDVSFATGLISSNTASLSATVTSLAVNTTYYTRVATIISGSTGAWTTAAATSTLAVAPSAGAGWTEVDITSVTVSWSSNGNPFPDTLYEVDLSTVAGFGSGDLQKVYTYGLSTPVDQLDSGVTYHGRVRAVNHTGIGTAFLDLGSTTTTSVPIPKNLAFSGVTTGSLAAAWDASMPPGDSYDFRVSTDPAFGGTVISSSTVLLSATVAGLQPNTTYYGAARSVIEGTLYPWSAHESTPTLANAPAVAAVTWAAVGITSMTVAWDGNGNPADITDYVVETSTWSDFRSAASTETKGLSVTVAGLLPSAVQYARVKAVNHAGVSTAFTALGSTTTQVPNPPTALAATAAQTNGLTASWTAPVPAPDGYVLQASPVSDFSAGVVSSATAALSATVGGLAVNATNYLRVEAQISGIASAWTATISTSTLSAPPSTVDSTWSAVDQTDVTMSWSPNGNPSDTVFRADLSDTADFSGNVFSTTTTGGSAQFAGLLTDTDYWGRVTAINRSGIESAYVVMSSTHTSAPNMCNAVATGNWSAATTWSNCTGAGGLPAATDAVMINSARVVTLDVDATVAGLTFAAPGSNDGLTHSGTHVLTVNGSVTFNQSTSNNRSNAWNINAGSATVRGPILFNGTSTATSRISQIVITSGELDALGGISFAASAAATKVIDMSGGAGRLNLAGAVTIPANSCTLTAGTGGSVFRYADSDAGQTVRFFSSGAYDNLELANTSSAGATLGASATTANVTGSLTVSSGLFKNGGFAITGGSGATFTVAGGAAFEMSGTSIFPTGYTTVSLAPTSRVRYRQTTSPLTLDALAFGYLDLMPAAAATQRFPPSGASVQQTLTVGDGAVAAVADLSTNNPALTVGGVVINSSATLSASASAPLSDKGDWSNAGTFTDNGGEVDVSGAVAQSIDNGTWSFGRLVSSNTAGGVTFPSGVTADGLVVNAAALSAPATLYFAAGSTSTIGSLTLAGASGATVVLRSTADGAPWYLGLTSTDTIAGVFVRDSNASHGLAVRAGAGSSSGGGNANWDFGAPAAVADLAAASGALAGEVDLVWSAPWDAPGDVPLTNAAFVIEYTTDTNFASGNQWSPTAAPPADVGRVSVSTTGVAGGDTCRYSFNGLTPGDTYQFRLWTLDEAANYAAISNAASALASPVISSVTLSASVLDFGSLLPGATVVPVLPVTVTNAGNSQVSFALSIDDPQIWHAGAAPGIDTFRLTAVFRSSLPSSTDFDASNDTLLDSTSTATTAVYALDADPAAVKGVNVNPNGSRTLWFRMEMPPLSTTTDPQTIRLHVSGE